MIDRTRELPVKRQAELIGISRGTVYYRPEPASPADLALMRRIDELHLEFPFAGSRMLRGLAIERANQVWAMDITYIPIAQARHRHQHGRPRPGARQRVCRAAVEEREVR